MLLGDGQGNFKYYGFGWTFGNYAVGMAAGDFNGDGNLDLAVVNLSGSVTIMLGDGAGSFPHGETIPLAGIPTAVTVADLNGDGNPDVAVADQCAKFTCKHGSAAVLLGNGDGTFQRPRYRGSPTPLNWIAAADMNRDGKMDLVAGGNATYVALGNGDGTFKWRSFPFSLPIAMVGDVNQDGYPDIVAPGRVLMGTTIGKLLLHTFSVHAGGESMALGNLDAGGVLDVAFTDYGYPDGSVSVLFGTGQ